VTRLIVSSLLESDLSVAEVAELGKTLLNDRHFCEELGELLLTVADRIRHQAARGSPRDDDLDWEWFADARRIIKRRRLPKREILSVVAVLCPKIVTSLNEEMPVDQILRLLAKGAPRPVREEFLKWLEGVPGGGDPYLEGIMKGKQG
jgi:hypothetical protein